MAVVVDDSIPGIPTTYWTGLASMPGAELSSLIYIPEIGPGYMDGVGSLGRPYGL